jgi:hypothetical protein
MIVHLFDACGLVSFGATHGGNYCDSCDTHGDNKSFEGQRLFKAMDLLASEICFAGTYSRMLFAQTI